MGSRADIGETQHIFVRNTTFWKMDIADGLAIRELDGLSSCINGKSIKRRLSFPGRQQSEGTSTSRSEFDHDQQRCRQRRANVAELKVVLWRIKSLVSISSMYHN